MDHTIQVTPFPPGSQQGCDKLVDTLVSALRATVLHPSPAVVAMAQRTLRDIHTIQENTELAVIAHFVERQFSLPMGALCSHSRHQRTCFARHLAFYLCRRLSGKSFPSIGAFYRRNHTSIIHGCQVIARRMTAEPGFAAFVHQLEQQIAGASPMAKAA